MMMLLLFFAMAQQPIPDPYYLDLAYQDQTLDELRKVVAAALFNADKAIINAIPNSYEGWGSFSQKMDSLPSKFADAMDNSKATNSISKTIDDWGEKNWPKIPGVQGIEQPANVAGLSEVQDNTKYRYWGPGAEKTLVFRPGMNRTPLLFQLTLNRFKVVTCN